jgi:hypothetical protein
MAYNEIRQTYSKKDCNCSKCGCSVKKDNLCIIDPKTRVVYCSGCGREQLKKK